MSRKVIIATGGTGGHIFPALSLLKTLEENGYSCMVIADKRFLNFKVKFPQGLKYKIISTGFFGSGFLRKIIALFKIVAGVFSSLLALIKYKPGLVISFGGYPSFPVMVAAVICRKPLVIHEQNSVVGVANKWMLGWAKVVSIPYEGVQGLGSISSKKIRVVGNPVDDSISKIGEVGYKAFRKNSKINLLVLGGSQGARILSKVIPHAVSKLKSDIRSRLNIVQQCREEDVLSVESIYKNAGVNFEVSTFFSDVDAKLEKAHLVIARAGASTVSELIASGRPSILVPITHSNKNHQYLNAKILSDSKAAWILKEDVFTPTELCKKLTYLLSNSHALLDASRNARSLFTDSKKSMLELVSDTYN